MRNGIADASDGHVEKRDVIVKGNIIRCNSEDAFVSPNILAKYFLAKFTLEPIAIRRGMGDNLDPKIAHLVSGVLAPMHTLGRAPRVSRVLRGVVVGVPHGECRFPAQGEWHLVTVQVLPI